MAHEFQKLLLNDSLSWLCGLRNSISLARRICLLEATMCDDEAVNVLTSMGIDLHEIR